MTWHSDSHNNNNNHHANKKIQGVGAVKDRLLQNFGLQTNNKPQEQHYYEATTSQYAPPENRESSSSSFVQVEAPNVDEEEETWAQEKGDQGDDNDDDSDNSVTEFELECENICLDEEYFF